MEWGQTEKKHVDKVFLCFIYLLGTRPRRKIFSDFPENLITVSSDFVIKPDQKRIVYNVDAILADSVFSYRAPCKIFTVFFAKN